MRYYIRPVVRYFVEYQLFAGSKRWIVMLSCLDPECARTFYRAQVKAFPAMSARVRTSRDKIRHYYRGVAIIPEIVTSADRTEGWLVNNFKEDKT